VIKPLDTDGNEVLPWVTEFGRSGVSTYAYRFYRLGNSSITLGGIIVGFDWNNPDVVKLTLTGETVKAEIEYILLISDVSSDLLNQLN